MYVFVMRMDGSNVRKRCMMVMTVILDHEDKKMLIASDNTYLDTTYIDSLYT
jgi:hypothetical protein